MNIRDIKRKARLDLHSRLAEQALYVSNPGVEPLDITGVSVRLHLNFAEVGELLRGGFAEGHELTPKVIFLATQKIPVRGAIVVTKDMGAWRIDSTLPPNDITISVEVVKVTDSQVAAYGWNPALQFMGLGAPDPIEPVGPPPLPLPGPNWQVDQW